MTRGRNAGGRFDEEFADFYSARFDAAHRTAYALCGDWVEAEELAQAGFVRLYAKWPRVVKGGVDAYLRTVLTRLSSTPGVAAGPGSAWSRNRRSGLRRRRT